MTNILVTSAGRRVELVQAFKAELECLVPGAKVFATDLQPGLSSACQVADAAFAMPRVTEAGYANCLLQLCEEEAIQLVVPTIDTELRLLANERQRFSDHGIHLVVSDRTLVENCRDKRRTASLFSSIGLDVPRLMDPEFLQFPCFAKPYDGSSSIGTKRLEGPVDLSDELLNDPKMTFWELVDQSFAEVTVDAYYDRGGRLHCVVPRYRIATRAGEVAKAVTRRDFVHEIVWRLLAELRGARGCLTVQVFARQDDERLLGLEINPRFGGGYPLSYAAGANFPAWLIEEYLLDRTPRFSDRWEENLMMLRYDAKVLVHGVC